MSSFRSCPDASSVTKAASPCGDIAIPNGCDARGSATVRRTARVAPSMTLIEAPSLLVTQIAPSCARARLRGALPTAISPSLARVIASNTLTESLSWFTTHSRAFPLAGVSTRRLLDAVGRLAVGGR